MSALPSVSEIDAPDKSLEFQGSFAPPQPSILWRGFKVIVSLLSETPLSVLGFIIAGLVMTVLFPPLSITCFFLAASTLASKWIWKTLSLGDFSLIGSIERKAVKFQMDHPYLQAAFVVSSFALLIISEIASILAAIMIGVFNGIVAEANLRFTIVEKNRIIPSSPDFLTNEEMLTC